MKLVKATDEHNKALIDFYKQYSYAAQTELELVRKNIFFQHYKIQSDQHTTYLLIDKEEQIQGMATLLFRDAWLQGKKQVIGFATDLRVSKNRAAIISWSKHFLPALEEEKKKHNCTYIFTVVSNKQTQAYNAFIRPRKKNRPLPRYFLYRKFKLISIHGLLPFSDEKLPGVTFRTAEYEDKDKLLEYMHIQKINKPIRFIDSKEDILRDIEALPYFNLQDFVIALDHKKQIVGCVAPWVNPALEIKIKSYNNALAMSAKQSLKFLSWIGMTRPLPNVGQTLPLNFMTHFFADNPDIFYSLLRHCYDSSFKRDILVYPHFKGHLPSLPPKGFIHSKAKFGLYCLLSPDEPVPGFLKPSPYKDPPDFEAPFLF